MSVNIVVGCLWLSVAFVFSWFFSSAGWAFRISWSIVVSVWMLTGVTQIITLVSWASASQSMRCLLYKFTECIRSRTSVLVLVKCVCSLVEVSTFLLRPRALFNIIVCLSGDIRCSWRDTRRCTNSHTGNIVMLASYSTDINIHLHTSLANQTTAEVVASWSVTGVPLPPPEYLH